jgi:DNA polymerase-3 subunit delta'
VSRRTAGPDVVELEPILGHAGVVGRLWGALDRGNLHHALLFEGPSGLGKRILALRLAMAANCANTPRPCGQCAVCRQIVARNHPDVLWIEPDPEKATQTIAVDQIREVVRQSGYHRFGRGRRVVIIDPAEALQAASANALLKTLEEPPEGTGFILLAVHAKALLPTIVSRCQRVRFAPVPEAELSNWLAAKGIADAPKLARLSQGRPGLALTLADGGLEARATLEAKVVGVLEGDLTAMFSFSEALCQGGRADWAPRVNDLLSVLEDRLRDTAVVASGARAPQLDPSRPSDRWLALWPSGVERCARAIEDARADLHANVGGRVVVDALLSRFRRELGADRM